VIIKIEKRRVMKGICVVIEFMKEVLKMINGIDTGNLFILMEKYLKGIKNKLLQEMYIY
jgi:hypothetical protein